MGKVWKRYFLTGMCFVLLLSLTSCGKKKVDYVEPDPAAGQTSAESDAKSESEIPQRVEETLTSDNGKTVMSINADVIYNENAEGIPVVKVSPKFYTEEDMQQYADRIFDEGTKKVWMSPQYLTKNGLLERKKYLEEELENYTEEDGHYYDWLIGQLSFTVQTLDEFEASDVQKDEWDKPEFAAYTYLDENGNETTTYLDCEIQGMIDGKHYILRFNKDFPRMILSSLDFTSAGYQETGTNSVYAINGNLCRYSKEEAVQMASELLERLGIEGLVPDIILDAQHPAEEGTSTLVDAYIIYFKRSVGGVTALDSSDRMYSGYITYDNEGNESIDYGYELLRVCVTDDGVIDMNYQTPLQVDEVTTEQASLLPFDDIQNRAREYITEHLLKGSQYTAEINSITLGLEQIYGEDGSCMLVPAWAFFQEDNDGLTYSKVTMCTINAIDGSYIEIQ